MSVSVRNLAPRGPIRGPQDRWDMFLSYRPLYRPWALRLYDQLRNLDHDVFMDQFALSNVPSLGDAADAHREHSATAVLVWSSDRSDADWCRQELRALEDLARRKPGFRHVLLGVDLPRAPLPARGQPWIDCSNAPDAPSGTALLQLLHGLRGEPVPADVATIAQAYDDAQRAASLAIHHARAAGDVEALRALLREQGPEWTSTATLRCKATEALIALGHADDALPTLERLLVDFTRSVRPQQLYGMALARRGDASGAQRVLSELHAMGDRDPQVLSVLAGTWRARHAASGDPLHLRLARDLDATAFEAAPDHHEAGLHAARASLLLGQRETAQALAARVEALVGADVVPQDYARTVAVGEVQLLLGRVERAAALFAAAVAEAPPPDALRAATLAALQPLLDRLGAAPEARAAVEAALCRSAV